MSADLQQKFNKTCNNLTTKQDGIARALILEVRERSLNYGQGPVSLTEIRRGF
jgi:hypothetical protein